MTKLRVGIIGSGFIAQFQARAMMSSRHMELSGILARSGAKDFSAWVQRENLGPAKIYPSISELCKHVDCVAVYVPNYAQVEIVELVAEAKLAGAPVRAMMIDKPLGRNLAEAARIVQLVEEADLRTAYFENQIFMKCVNAQKAQLARVEEAMGAPLLVRTAEEHAGPHMPWFWDPTRSGGGVLLDMGCHSIAVGWYLLSPNNKAVDYLEPISVSCNTSLLKWGQPHWSERLRERFGVDYCITPAEDFAAGIVTFEDPETKRQSLAQFTDSWMYDKQGLRLYMEGVGAGYGFEINTLQSPVNIFIGDAAAAAIEDAETALEKSTSSRGLLPVQPNEADLYGYVDENEDAAKAFLEDRDGKLNVQYGYKINRLVMASYLSAELKKTIDLKDLEVDAMLKNFIPKVQQGRGRDLWP